MNDSFETVLSLDERALKAAADKTAHNDMIEEFRPFLHNCTARYASADRNKHDELFSVAMLAFSEAITKFDSSKGNFFSFAANVVRRRLIDEVRRHYKSENNVYSLDDLGEDGEQSQSDIVSAASQRLYADQQSNLDLIAEIEQFKTELAQWKITMPLLVQQAPKHAALRVLCLRAVALAAKDPQIMQAFHLKHYLPVKKIAEISKIPPKKLERMRTFIIASLIIKTGDYEKLSGYVSEREGDFI